MIDFYFERLATLPAAVKCFGVANVCWYHSIICAVELSFSVVDKCQIVLFEEGFIFIDIESEDLFVGLVLSEHLLSSIKALWWCRRDANRRS